MFGLFFIGDMKPVIYDETNRLEEVLVWGEPGIEALLGQLLPKSKSLFFSYYKVLEARREFRRFVLEQLRAATGTESEYRAEARRVLGVDPP